MTETFEPRTTPWHIDDSEFYELESYDERMRFLLRYAVLAPSTRNTQPWTFRISSAGIEVFADYTRRLLTIDPGDRELLMSVGAAITNLRVAAAHFGYDTSVFYETEPEELAPVPRISIRETCAPDRNLTALFTGIRKRHTNRGEFDGRPIDPEILSRMCDVIDMFPDTLRLVLRDDKTRAAELIAYADRSLMERPAFRAEAADWIHADEEARTDGVSSEAFGIPHILSAGAAWFIRKIGGGDWQGNRDRHLAESASALLIVSANDDRPALIQAGEALERLLLQLAALGLQYSFFNQPIEVADLRERVQMLVGSRLPAQLLLRIGTAPPVELAMPRRPVEQVVSR